MVQMAQNKPAAIAEAYKEILQIVKTTANTEIKAKEFVLRVGITSVNSRVYGGCQYIKSIDDQNTELQLIVQADMAKTLELGHGYEVRGSFEVSALPSFGFFQFRVAEAVWIAADMKLEAKKQAARFLLDALEAPKQTYQEQNRAKRRYVPQTYDKPRDHSQKLAKSQAGSLLIYAALFIALAIVAGIFFFAVIPKLFEAILIGS
ncbi:hypothetical protein ACX93W_14505 [Paenibacillus sp. CAU 1782]